MVMYICVLVYRTCQKQVNPVILSVTTTTFESVLSSKEASKEKQNLPSSLGDTTTSNESQREKKDQECISDTSTNKDQVQEDLPLFRHETATNKKVCERGGDGGEECRAKVI